MLQWILRAVVSTAVVVVLVTVASTEGIREAFSQVRASVWLATLGVFLTGHAMNAWKYQRLLQDPQASLSLCLRAHFAGLVANLGLPGVAGGDVVRATYLLPHGVRPKAATVASVIDRLVDTLTLLVLAGAGMLIAGRPPGLDATTIGIRWPMIVAAVVAVGAVAAYVLVKRRRGGGAGMAGDLLAAVRARRGAIVTAAAVTTVVQSAFVLSNVWMAGALGLDIGIAPWFMAWPLSKIISILPISLGGHRRPRGRARVAAGALRRPGDRRVRIGPAVARRRSSRQRPAGAGRRRRPRAAPGLPFPLLRSRLHDATPDRPRSPSSAAAPPVSPLPTSWRGAGGAMSPARAGPRAGGNAGSFVLDGIPVDLRHAPASTRHVAER